MPGAQAPHLARDLDTLPDAEVTDDPGEQETQGQLPAQAAQVLDARADAENTSPADEGWGGENMQELFQCEQTQRIFQQSQIQSLLIGQTKPELILEASQQFEIANL